MDDLELIQMLWKKYRVRIGVENNGGWYYTARYDTGYYARAKWFSSPREALKAAMAVYGRRIGRQVADKLEVAPAKPAESCKMSFTVSRPVTVYQVETSLL